MANESKPEFFAQGQCTDPPVILNEVLEGLQIKVAIFKIVSIANIDHRLSQAQRKASLKVNPLSLQCEVRNTKFAAPDICYNLVIDGFVAVNIPVINNNFSVPAISNSLDNGGSMFPSGIIKRHGHEAVFG